LFNDSFGVFAFGWLELKRVGDESKAFVESEDESAVGSVVGDNVNGEYRYENGLANRAEQDDRRPQFKGTPHLPIVAVSAACPVVVGVEGVTHVSICVRALRVRARREITSFLPVFALSLCYGGFG
jgi:hypothetical protein